MDPGVEDSMQGADTDPLPPPPPPLTTGSPLPIPEHAPPQSSGDLTPCPCCSRTFNLDALRKHIVICEKTSKKRKVFDSSRQRRDGTALSTYVLPKNFGLPNAERTVGVPVPPAPVSTAAVAAPAEPQSFPRSTARASMRKAASTLSNSSSTETPPAAPVAPAPPTVRERSQAKRIKAPACDRCPHCERTFNPKAFDRHVEWCKEKAIQANMKSGNSQETSKAKERLEARKQYKPPNLKTKRSLARDKYSGNHEELLEAGDMSAPKPNIMSLSMTSSVHSDNAQVIKARTSPAATKESRGWAGTKVTQNQVSLDMSNDEDVASSPASSVRATTSSRRLSKRQHIAETCSEIDDTMDRIKRNSLKLARLDCEDAPILQPSAKTRRAVIKRGKVDAVDKELSLPNLPQVTMTFDELNGLIKRKGGTPICNVQMDEQEIGTLTTKQRSATSASIVRQARRRISTRESPSLGLQSHQQESLLAKNLDFGSFDSSLQRSCNYTGSDDDDNVDSPRAEIQIKMEATTMRTVCRPPKKSGHKLKHSESMLALPMPGLKQSLEAINKSMGQTVLPRLKLGNERAEYDQEEEEDNYNSDLDYEEEGPLVRYSQEDNQSDEQEEEVEEEPVLKLPPLVKQNSNITRRLVVEQDENGTVYIKSGPKAKRRSDASTSSQSQPEERLQRQQSNASRGHEEKQSRFQELERRADAEDQQKREIFISIETEANAQGRSPISPESLRHMVGNPQTPIDVLHIENGNEPEHARFSKISDTEDAGQEPGDRASQLGSNTNTNRLAPSLSASTLAPNVQLNNAKNLMQQMQSDFRQLGEEASASVRRQLMLNSGRSEEHQHQQQQQQFRNQETGQQEQQHHHQQQQHAAPLTPSPSADSDELSSLDGYPMSSSQSSRRGASSKLSSDSAYGSSNSPYSLSRQRSSELQPIGGTTHRSQGLLRPHTASAKLPSTTSDACTQAQTQYGTLKARQRLFGNGGSVCGGGNGNGEGVECSSSGSEDNSQQPIQQQQQASNYNYQQQQQQQQQHQLSQPVYSNNNNLPMTPTISQHSLLSNNSNNSMSSSMKMSKFCHECGAKFIIEHAKFCMDCGVRRMVL